MVLPVRLKQMLLRSTAAAVLSGAQTLLASETDGLAFDFTDITALQPRGSGQIKDTATPSNAWATSSGVTPFNKLTFARASNATYFDSAGLMQTASSNVARIDYNPSTLAIRGLLMEEARTNSVLNSTIDGANLATQSVTVTAVAHTLSFYGTGSITLSGAHVATLNGSGAFPTRSTLTFTPSAGSLTLTVSGTVSYAQLEVGSFATSFIPTAGSTTTRAAETCSIATTAFNYSTSVGTAFVEFSYFDEGTGGLVTAGTDPNGRLLYLVSGGNPGLYDGANYTPTGTAVAANATKKAASAYSGSTTSVVHSGGTVATGTFDGAMDGTNLHFGQAISGNLYNGHIRKVMHLPRRMSNSAMQTLTT